MLPYDAGGDEVSGGVWRAKSSDGIDVQGNRCCLTIRCREPMLPDAGCRMMITRSGAKGATVSHDTVALG